ncbi:tetratricopeptide repeat protein [Kaarinaea lacus]
MIERRFLSLQRHNLIVANPIMLFAICIIAMTAFGYAVRCDAIVPQKILQEGAQPLNETINSYTKIINSNRLVGSELALRYWERGKQFASLGHYDAAIDDYSKTIRLAPNFVSAYVDRAVAYARLEKYKLAYQDLNLAVKTHPDDVNVYKTRGALSFLLGKYDYAAADYKRYLQLKPGDLYRILWLHLSEKYQNRNANSSIRSYINGVDLAVWPGAIVELYAGDIEVENLSKALSQGVRDMTSGHVCEAYYYIGQYYLLQNDKSKALELFNKAVATNAKSYIEYEFALAYSRKLAQ